MMNLSASLAVMVAWALNPMPRIYNLPQFIDRRKNLRNTSTISEVVLWSRLRQRKLLGYKFRRQQGIGTNVVDFYCPRLKLAVEIDGGQHAEKEQRMYDGKRQAWIESWDILVVRFTNADISNNINGVLDNLKKIMLQRAESRDHPGSPLASQPSS